MPPDESTIKIMGTTISGLLRPPENIIKVNATMVNSAQAHLNELCQAGLPGLRWIRDLDGLNRQLRLDAGWAVYQHGLAHEPLL